MGFLLTLAALLALTDPIGDALGNGTLVPPTAAVLETVGGFDLEVVEVLEGDTLAVQVGLVSVPSQLTLIEVYLDTGDGGASDTLPGSGMRLPEGTGWEVALRVTRDGATAFLVAPPLQEGGPVGPPEEVPVVLVRNGRLLTVRTPFEAPAKATAYALVGLYDPFGETPWRPVASRPSPWAFSSEEPAYPVVDLLAAGEAEQARALETGVLPEPKRSLRRSPWAAIMVLGVVLALGGLALRTFLPVLRSRRRRVATPDSTGVEGAAPGSGTAPAGRFSGKAYTASAAGPGEGTVAGAEAGEEGPEGPATRTPG